MNTVKCKDCRHYDVIRSGKTKAPKHGWCAARSIYPFKEGPGQIFPPGVQRVAAEGMHPTPEIVTGNSVVPNCPKVFAK